MAFNGDSLTARRPSPLTTADPSINSPSSLPTRPKSPPLAFEPTSNDALAPRISHFATDSSAQPPLASPSAMGRHPSPSAEVSGLRVIVDQQSSAIQLLHDAFSAERLSWTFERERLYARIAALERLLKTGDHYSPAKSPVLSPSGSSALTSPQTRASAGAHHLPSIAEDANLEPLSRRREGAPQSIAIPPIREENERRNSVSFSELTPRGSIQVEEIPISPLNARTLSPPPPSFRKEAGHTPPLHAVRPPTPPPKNSLSMDGIEDTPTRHNTHINTFLTRSNDEEDTALKGPLNLPELPHQPNETNFTLEMLSKKLEMIEKHPEETSSRPMVFAEPSPGLASPVGEGDDYLSPRTRLQADEAPFAPVGTRNADPSVLHSGHSSTKARSPSATVPGAIPAFSPSGAPLSQQHSRELQEQQQQFEQGGIKLKKKPSVNFGAPFGQLGGFGGVRRQS